MLSGDCFACWGTLARNDIVISGLLPFSYVTPDLVRDRQNRQRNPDKLGIIPALWLRNIMYGPKAAR